MPLRDLRPSGRHLMKMLIRQRGFKTPEIVQTAIGPGRWNVRAGLEHLIDKFGSGQRPYGPDYDDLARVIDKQVQSGFRTHGKLHSRTLRPFSL
ncbi:hypothetical protein [Asticcacaulis sp. MM231]|uniref:hypothetical protein n=1 Tax=Asticcacaulis sp. MM231 TaxID=3157666 RepID=UPI0032D58787